MLLAWATVCSLTYPPDPYNTNGGGGFFQGGGGGSQSSQGGQRKRNDTLRPVTIKQLNEASQPHPDADFLIDDVDVGQVRVRSRSQGGVNWAVHSLVVDQTRLDQATTLALADPCLCASRLNCR